VLCVERHQFILLETGMQFDLVDTWNDAGLIDDSFQMGNCEIRNAHRSQLAFGFQFDQGFPGFSVRVLTRFRPVNEKCRLNDSR